MKRNPKDERSAGARDTGIAIQWFGFSCRCRCRHCLLRSGAKVTTVPFQKAKALAERFVRWREANGVSGFPVDLTTGYACDSPHVLDVVRFNRTYGATSQFFSANGIGFRTEEELRRLFSSLKDAGTGIVGVTFYGLRDRHDRWAGRKGDFDYVLLVARVGAEVGLERRESIFLWRESIPDLIPLLDLLDGLPGPLRDRGLFPWDYRGRGKSLERERVTSFDVENLPERARRLINLDGHKGYRSEAEWVRRIAAGDFSKKDRRYYCLTVWDDNIQRFEAMDCDRILQDMRDEDERLYQAIPSLPTLARLYGRKSGKRLYSLRDLEWKWTDLYLQTHPEIDNAAGFDDLGTAILWK